MKGMLGDISVSTNCDGDNDGDGDTDLAYFRSLTGICYVYDDGTSYWTWFGALPEALIIPGDINGDGVPW